MFTKNAVRRAEVIHNDWVPQSDGSIVTKAGCKIYIPARWTEQRLAFIGNETVIFGFFAVMVGEAYGVCNAATMVSIRPGSTRQVNIDGFAYYEFSFDPGTVVVRNLNCVMDDTMPYQMYREFIEMGKVPPYLNYTDACNMFESCGELCGVTLGANEAVLSAISSSIMKDPQDLGRSYAFCINAIADQNKVRPAVVPFRDVQYGATNTTAKIMGSYSDLAVTAALVNPSERTEDFEDLLR